MITKRLWRIVFFCVYILELSILIFYFQAISSSYEGIDFKRATGILKDNCMLAQVLFG